MFSEDKPINIPSFVGSQIVKELQAKPPKEADHWVRYKAVVRKRASTPNSYDMRIYDEFETETKGVKITDYAFLDDHPDLVQFAGWFDPQTKKVEIKSFVL